MNELAGRIPTLDELAKYYLFPWTARKKVFEEAKELVKKETGGRGFGKSKAGQMKDYYLRLFQKWADLAEDNVGDAKDWVEKESNRLKKLATKKGQIQVQKLEEVKMKQNVRPFLSSTPFEPQSGIFP